MENQEKKIYNGGKMISSGSFGCVYNPSLTCSGKESVLKINRKKITKLMYKDYTSLNEHNIGHYIQTNIPQHRFFFASVTIKCRQKKKITVKTVRKHLEGKGMKKCDLLDSIAKREADEGEKEMPTPHEEANYDEKVDYIDCPKSKMASAIRIRLKLDRFIQNR